MTGNRIPSHRVKSALALCTTLSVSGVLAEENAVATHCFTTAETRDKITGQKLGDPFISMRAAETRVKGEALNARLCRKGDDFIYEISLVRQDGRVVKLLYNAATGQALSLHKSD